MSNQDDFNDVRRDPDPISRGRRATELLTFYQQRATELARLRRAAIDQAHDEQQLSYTEIASAIGVTKGRVTQIRSTAPGPERAFFGVGPVSVGVPYRYRTTDRERPLIAAEDAQAGEQLEQLLTTMALSVTRFQIEPDRSQVPSGDTVVVCGPKSAPIAGDLLSQDPSLTMVEEDGRWWIRPQSTAERYGSPTDDADQAEPADLAYVARHRGEDRTLIHIAGVHAIGSLGAAHYLTTNLAELFAKTGDVSFSLAVRSTYDGVAVTGSELAAGPFVW